MILSLLLFGQFSHCIGAASPVWLGPKFREESFVTPQMNEELENICGRQPFSNKRDFPWAVSIMLK
ncbi:hypothetical protein GCK32_022323, partial [Trichostrongylus colubriformis]